MFASQRLRLHYVNWGNEEAPILLLIHGGRDHCRNWDWTARALKNEWRIIAPDLRGHGDSAWSPDGNYSLSSYTYDLAQLVEHLGGGPVAIVGHSLGGMIALRYAGLFPAKVSKVFAIEGLGPTPQEVARRSGPTINARMRVWIDEQRNLSARAPKRYLSVEAALARMMGENAHLNPDQAAHLTRHGVSRNEDGSYSWKFDNYVRSMSPSDLSTQETEQLWSSISCPVLLLHGSESWASQPSDDERVALLPDARTLVLEGAGHWVHHDRLNDTLAAIESFFDS